MQCTSSALFKPTPTFNQQAISQTGISPDTANTHGSPPRTDGFTPAQHFRHNIGLNVSGGTTVFKGSDNLSAWSPRYLLRVGNDNRFELSVDLQNEMKISLIIFINALSFYRTWPSIVKGAACDAWWRRFTRYQLLTRIGGSILQQFLRPFLLQTAPGKYQK